MRRRFFAAAPIEAAILFRSVSSATAEQCQELRAVGQLQCVTWYGPTFATLDGESITIVPREANDRLERQFRLDHVFGRYPPDEDRLQVLDSVDLLALAAGPAQHFDAAEVEIQDLGRIFDIEQALVGQILG